TVTLTVTNAFGTDSETKTNYITVNASSNWYQDLDSDNYGNNAVSAFTCIAPLGYVANGGDCNDSNAAVNPGVAENVCNNIDDNCNGTIDEGRVNGCTNASACNYNAAATCDDGSCTFAITWYLDADADGYYVSTQNSCSSPGAGWTSILPTGGNSDCNDANAAVNFGATEVCFNLIDDDCDGLTDEGCCTTPDAPSAISGPIGVCRSQVGIEFIATPVVGATSYLWTLPTGATGSSTTNSILLNFSSTYNTGNLCVQAVNACGQSIQTCVQVLVFLTVPATPGAISGGSTDACANTSKVYSIGVVPNTTSYLWTAPTNSSITAGQGTTTVTVTYASNFGSSGTLSVRAVNCKGNSGLRTLTVYNIPGTPGIITGPNAAVCGGSTQNYSIVAMNAATSYNWTVPAGAVINSGQGTNAINVTFPANYTSGSVTVSASSACGTGGIRTLAVGSVPSLPSSVTGQTTNLCGGGSFTYTVPAVTGAISYNWTAPSGCTITANSGTSITLSVPANFVSGNLCYTVTNACGTSAMRCNALSMLPATPASISGPATTCANATGLVFTTAQVGTFTYTWTVPATCTIVSGQGTNTITVNWGAVTGNVLVKAVNACGSSSNRSKTVSIVTCLQPGGDENNGEGNGSLVEKDLQIEIFPNPNSGHFTVRSVAAGNFYITNELGQVVKSFNLNADNMNQIEVEGLTTGLYVLVGNCGGQLIEQKILVAY
ncbi:MAG: MopE-related protein, partial [Flavobacteriales bacterium]